MLVATDILIDFLRGKWGLSYDTGQTAGSRILMKAEVVVANAAFDVTPHRYVSDIITEKGIAREPYESNLRDIGTLTD